MYEPVLIISDTHYHNFSQYAQIAPSGVNTRLGDILRATMEAAQALRRAGGRTIIHAGDVFHVRGSLPPSVLNPVVDLYRSLIKSGFEIHMISGNHDLESDVVARLSSSVSALEGAGVHVYHRPTTVEVAGRTWLMVPWVKDLHHLRRIIAESSEAGYLIIHAPLNGVIKGIPDHGLTPDDFEGLGFKYVFCGHYHNHRVFDITDGHVVSVGALTHQNWGDVESQAGYIILGEDDTLTQSSTCAPKFIRIGNDRIDLAHKETFADNYVKVIGDYDDPSEIQAIKDRLTLAGAKAVVVDGAAAKPITTRGVRTTGTAPSLESILGEYLDRTFPGDAATKAMALEIIGMTDDYS